VKYGKGVPWEPDSLAVNQHEVWESQEWLTEETMFFPDSLAERMGQRTL
jgi:hypothetical protein